MSNYHRLNVNAQRISGRAFVTVLFIVSVNKSPTLTVSPSSSRTATSMEKIENSMMQQSQTELNNGDHRGDSVKKGETKVTSLNEASPFPRFVTQLQSSSLLSACSGRHIASPNDAGDFGFVDIKRRFECLDLSREPTTQSFSAPEIATSASSKVSPVSVALDDAPRSNTTPLFAAVQLPTVSLSPRSNDVDTEHLRLRLQQQTSVELSRERFLKFIKILFKILDQAKESHTRNRAKQVVAECTRKNRLGDPNYVPLVEAVQKRLSLFVGEAYWRKALLFLRYYYEFKHEKSQEGRTGGASAEQFR
jgi:hypothetical protein